MSEETTTTTTITDEMPPGPPSLTLQDLTTMIQVLETGTQRGAWKPGELSSVGLLYDRITAFVNAARLAKEAADGNTEQ